jgi:hypothetical protein
MTDFTPSELFRDFDEMLELQNEITALVQRLAENAGYGELTDVLLDYREAVAKARRDVKRLIA